MSDATRKAERILKRARRDADKLRENAQKEDENMRDRRFKEAENLAAGKARSIVAGIPYEERKIKLLKQERVFSEVFDEALKRLHEGEGAEGEIDLKKSLQTLLAEALEEMPDAELIVQVNPRDRTVAESVITDVNRPAGMELMETEAVGAGVRVSTARGNLAYDNTIQARFERQRDQLRSELAHILNPGNEGRPGGNRHDESG